MKRITLALLFGAAVATLAGSAQAVGTLADVQVYDRAEGRYLPLYYHEGHYYVVGRPGNEYQVMLRNNGPQRVLAVASVDGVNVVTGESAAPEQTGYVIDPHGRTDIKGWRKNLSRTAAFYFTSLSDSYAARTGRPWDVGVIGVALFRERAPAYYYPPEPYGPYKDLPAGKAKSLPGPQSDAAPGAAPPRAESKSLGTGHGRNEWAPAQYSGFERASPEPDEIIAINYDSYANLVAQGVIPQYRHYARPEPNPFPQRFVPDPRW